MNTHLIFIETPNASQEVINKIKSITSPDVFHAWKNPLSVYYGEVSQQSFDIKSVRYGTMSSAPNIKGEVYPVGYTPLAMGEIKKQLSYGMKEQTGKTIIKVDMDIKSNYTMVRNMYYSTLLPIGVLVLIATLFVLGDTEYWLQGYIFSGTFIAFPFLVTWLEKSSLVKMKKEELKNLASRIEGKIISA